MIPKIAIPSYKRADRLVGRDYFKSALYVVPESQADEYIAQVGKRRVVAIPDRVDGNMARKRNWILKNMGRPLVMIDDDVVCLRTAEGMKDNGKLNQARDLTSEEATEVIAHGFNLANEWGIVFWGLNINPDGRIYHQYRPFSLNQIVLGPFQAHLVHGFLYDPKMGTKEDYDFSIQVLNDERKLLRLNKYSYVCDHGDNPGGIVSYRTMDLEVQYCRAIERKWGRDIIRYPMKPKRISQLLNGRVNIPIGDV